jgi:hypothetical protein
MNSVIEHLAGDMYSAYCERVGWRAWNGEQLPQWEQFRADPTKRKQASGWLAAAEVAYGQLGHQ